MSASMFITLIPIILSFFYPTFLEAQSGLLPEDELNALKEIADQLGKKDWDFSVNPCDKKFNQMKPIGNGMPEYVYNNSISCNCSFPAGICHVDAIVLKAQSLQGVLPPSLAKLPFIKTIDLSRNYLSGTIPLEWASTKLKYLAVIVNRLSGPIPKYLGNITTLEYLGLENNMFNGTVPPELGKLVKLKKLFLGANYLTGEWPKELNSLTKLKEFRLSSNNFTGKLPSFQGLGNLEELEVQASGFEGPIPENISLLTSLTELRISDLNGGGVSKFPILNSMKGLRKLLLRRCNISGKIPEYIANMTSLRQLDLSFNNLEGGIDDLQIDNAHYIYLTSNSLSGHIPQWFLNRDPRYYVDLSYNKFEDSYVPLNCRENVNLFKSHNGGDNSLIGKCLKQCTKDWYSFHINCGGGNVSIGDTTYDADDDSSGLAKFVSERENWVTSNTGFFWDKNKTLTDYTATNISLIKGKDSEIYRTARLSPLSLVYYRRCLANGNYTVKLHFAEIVLRDDNSFLSLGRRIFDVYIQGERKLKDFDIKAEAHGADKALVKQFQAVVRDKTLEVRLEYAGKGTTAVPIRGNYGSLISAISVESDFKPPKNRKTVIIVAAIASSLFLIFAILCFVGWMIYTRNKTSREKELQGLDLRTGRFTFKQIKAATNNFASANKIGEGGFGPVYKGTLLDGTVIAVKQLSSKSKQGNREFLNEISMISCLEHPNLVKLHGCCVEGKQLLLVYEYLENNSLAHALFGPEDCQLKIDWATRQRICVGIAKGLAFLHEESEIKIVHRDIKATNVLLDKELNPKISDFGLAKLDDEDKTHLSTKVAGTLGYMAPEYAMWGYLTYKADVYSFGVVALEIVAGKNNMKYQPDEDYVCLLDWALVLQENENLMELIDPRLGSDFDKEQALRMAKVALLCTNPSPVLRPSMSAVVRMLEGLDDVHAYKSDQYEFNSQAMTDQYDDIPVGSSDSPYKVNISSDASKQMMKNYIFIKYSKLYL
ncbi:probable leucine-rich repeat receptor-like serine/threonine-protein kinase At3g14840 isoform X1 [Ipomoea triloba]|uniref:probable leucine-rich repeat receptor-like serine/threonine-protein kinase At3g14840 isoform X1 n=1 Tax=Ipomoea triloba TaxID=35885 RepID=UPI00125D17A1|nr:probable leucine-rich repeat receptor-like serine/threonine-protein kinase At3g14840 isoform X1 [Ipomoea triloba]XP_031120545.1 probable leucine-rich repeat receptor-like serine/threonine-protein kinase At3g14840 isoform X1 [Ipomoea triloba]XP_031120551.1 probable leucine-rich repeat receptor-like serine/threonine-protein kinase At3g14840 isoform X1 [Ipomoea triloba]